jgi:hypothetical protein
MSAPNTDPTAGAPSGAASPEGAGAGASGGQAGGAGAASGPGDPGSGDYLDRFGEPGSFAREEHRKMQSNRDKEAARATAAEERLEKLGRYREDDPSLIVSSLDEYLTWKTNPDVQKAIEKVISGGNASPEGDGTEEFLSDEQKEIRELRQENAQIKQRLAGTELSFGQ